MRRAQISVHGTPAGVLEELERGKAYQFNYNESYSGAPVSFAMPLQTRTYRFKSFPPFLDGLLPEGIMLDALLRQRKIDREDYLSQLLAVGADLVGALTVEEIT